MGQTSFNLSGGEFMRVTVRNTYPTNTQGLRLRIVPGDIAKSFGSTTIADLIVDISTAQTLEAGGSRTHSVLSTDLAWRRIPQVMSATLHASTIAKAET